MTFSFKSRLSICSVLGIFWNTDFSSRSSRRFSSRPPSRLLFSSLALFSRLLFSSRLLPSRLLSRSDLSFLLSSSRRDERSGLPRLFLSSFLESPFRDSPFRASVRSASRCRRLSSSFFSTTNSSGVQIVKNKKKIQTHKNFKKSSEKNK